MDTTLDEDVELVVARTKHERYRELAATRPDYVPVIREMAARLRGEPDPRPTSRPSGTPPSPAQAELQAAEGCIHRDPGAGCCSGTTCELARRRVTILQCLECIRDRDLDVQSGQLTVAIPQVIVVQ